MIPTALLDLSPPATAALDLLRAALDAGLVVLIWLVQLVIYPSFREVAPDRFQVWHARYSTRVSWVVIPLMLGQLAVLGLDFVAGERPWLPGGLIAGAWAATFGVSVPVHSRLAREGPGEVDRLVRTNWLRTILWTLVPLARLIG